MIAITRTTDEDGGPGDRELGKEGATLAGIVWALYECWIRQIESRLAWESFTETDLCARARLLIQTWEFAALWAAAGTFPESSCNVDCSFGWSGQKPALDEGFMLGRAVSGVTAASSRCAHASRCLSAETYVSRWELEALSQSTGATAVLNQAMDRCLPLMIEYKVTIGLDRDSAGWALGSDKERDVRRIGESMLISCDGGS